MKLEKCKKRYQSNTRKENTERAVRNSCNEKNMRRSTCKRHEK